MDNSSELFRKILQHLSDRHSSGFSLEELSVLVAPISNCSTSGSISNARDSQSLLLDALLALEQQGYIFLDPLTDCSCITLKGLIITGSTAYSN